MMIAQRSRLALAALLLAAMTMAVAGQTPSDPFYDHQTQPYTAKFYPASINREVLVTPFFSPDWSITTLVELIENVEYGGTIDIGTPGFSSWSGCTAFTGCNGCTIPAARAESFPIFPAILNAVHVKGATVRLLTNSYNAQTCAGKIAPLDFLALNGVTVRYYDTTTFWHAKYISVDGRNASVSSVNYSYTSFMKNREAGVVLGEGSGELIAFMREVFDSDWGQATDYVVQQTYTASEMEMITDKSYIPVVIPERRYIPGAYVTPYPEPLSVNAEISLYTSPDYARTNLFQDINSTQSSFDLFMYQVTDQGLCDALQGLHEAGATVTMLVSAVIYDPKDSASAAACYKQLTAAGMTIYTTPTYYTYSHQKYWIVDGEIVGLSTGNWSPTDYPDQAYFPPYGTAGWADSNRDFNLRMKDPRIVETFANVMQQDLNRGGTWSGSF